MTDENASEGAGQGRIRTRIEAPIGWIIIDHEARRNAMNLAMWRRVPGAFFELAKDARVRVIVLRGAGSDAFVSGADISEFAEVRAPENAPDYEAENERAFAAVQQCERPVIAMIHGFCMGGGVGLAVGADLRIASEQAVFGVPAARLGLGYPPENLKALLDLLGPARTKELFFTARRFTAAEALGMGFLNEVVPHAQLEARTLALASAIAENAPLTLRAIKRTIANFQKPAADRDDQAVAEAVRACFESQDYREGVQAFLEKRPPVFRGG